MKPFVRIHNAETNEVIDREMNETEFAQYKLEQANNAKQIDEEAKLASAKAALLAKLGITADEARLLLGGN